MVVNNPKSQHIDNQYKWNGLRFLKVANIQVLNTQYVNEKNMLKCVNLCKPGARFSTGSN